ncbi:NADPH-dependent F420 reductase [Streptomyces lushanensis]|uniref:NADPH-dependent F420 reductase n=1 Tax=Streptomyces lushanensis TaxID=1434255 RepID=UPI000830CE2A|nr:NAD(P)-binding domain-containing protein [Streptomyces lushanensis]
MTTIAILGSGTVARAIAGKLHDAGNRVVVGSRAPRRTQADWSGSAVGSGIRVTDPPDAAGSAEVVVNATPGHASVEVLTGLAAELTDKVLVDIANATALGSDGFASALLYPGGSLAEEIQRALPRVHVVKSLNTMHASVMADPAGLAVPPAAFLSGDDAGAKKTVSGLLAELGWSAEWITDLGGVETARGPEAFVLMVGGLVRALGPVPFAMAVAR